MIVSLIVGHSRNLVIGNNNQIPWHIPADLKYFKKTTTDHHILMGRKNYESIGRPLPNRTNVVITRQHKYSRIGIVVVGSIEEGLALAKYNGDDEAFICGGGEIYRQSIELVDKMYITTIEAEIEGDIVFPEVDLSKWEMISEEFNAFDEKNEFGQTNRIYTRKK